MRGAKSERAIELAVERDGTVLRGERCVIACSGGPDSVALAAVLCATAPTLDLQLTIAHVNHGVRASAWQDEAVVLRVAAALGLAVRIAALPGERKDEAGLREARYSALAEIAVELGADVIATGHSAEDQTETVMLALFRGTGPDGIAGIPARRSLSPGIDLIRPLLRFDHASLAGYCRLRALPYALDPTNADTAYRRNAVRAALEALRPAFPGLDAAVSRTAGLLGAERSGEDRAGLRLRVRAALRENDALRDVDFTHVEAAVRALESGGSGRFFMSAGVEMMIEGGRLAVRKRS
ncbi:MAG: tRNA lysidine(34) synthetase TilS [Candidatus Eremiobacteraeota bacterium]|nr:tRNA lysidine(34) synthetase TilS [Candidatus Eremiobacteraeota bacterium]